MGEKNTVRAFPDTATKLPGLQSFRNANNPYIPNGSKQAYLQPVSFSHQELFPLKQQKQESAAEYLLSSFNPHKQTKTYYLLPSIQTLPNPVQFPQDKSTLPAP